MRTKVFKTILLVMLCICFKENSFAQTGAKRPNRSIEKNEAAVVLVKNPEAESMVVQGVQVDKRIVKYYPPGELQNSPPEKLAALHHIYLDSYEILNKSEQSADCKSKLKEQFDLGKYNYLRSEDKRVQVDVNFEGCLYKLSLFSWNEIDKMR